LPVSSAPPALARSASWNPFAASEPARAPLDNLPPSCHGKHHCRRPSECNICCAKLTTPVVQPKLLAPPPPPMTKVTTIELVKRRGDALGVRFLCDAGSGGAELESVEPFGLAWRYGLRWGDVVAGVFVVSTGKDHDLKSGAHAARILRPATGEMEFRVLRRRRTNRDRAASLIQARVLGVFARDTIRLRSHAATAISAHFRRWCAVMDARALRLDKTEDDAAILVQYAWRRYMRRWEQRLAVEYIQQIARSFVASLRCGQRARKRRCIRAPPALDDF